MHTSLLIADLHLKSTGGGLNMKAHPHPNSLQLFFCTHSHFLTDHQFYYVITGRGDLPGHVRRRIQEHDGLLAFI